MNAKSAATSLGAATAPAVLIIGASLTASAIAGLVHDRDAARGEAGRLRSRPPATASPAPHTPSRTPSARPTSAPTSVVATGGVRALGAQSPAHSASRPSGTSPSGGGGSSSGSGQQTGPSTAQPAGCTGVVSVRVLSACVSIGGK